MAETYLRTAVEVVRAASRVCQAVRAELVTDETIEKRDKSPVTVADFAAQAVVSATLGRAFPEIPLVAEEESSAFEGDAGGALLERVHHFVKAECPGLGTEDVAAAIARGNHGGGPEGVFWCLDPIDGTKGFIRGDQYAVALGLIADGQVVLGVLGCPNLPEAMDQDSPLGQIYYAVKGQGAWRVPLRTGDPEPVTVSERDETSKAVFCESVESGHTRHDASSEIIAGLGSQGASVRLDSQCKYAVVARGEADVYLRLPTRPDYEERIWDHAAGWCVITEAGGSVTDVTGAPLDFSKGRTLRANRGVVGTNGAFHDEVIAVVRRVLDM